MPAHDYGICEIHWPKGWPRGVKRVECTHGWYRRTDSQEGSTERRILAQEEFDAVKAQNEAKTAEWKQAVKEAELALQFATAAEEKASQLREELEAVRHLQDEKAQRLSRAKSYAKEVQDKMVPVPGRPSTHGLVGETEPEEVGSVSALALAGSLIKGD